MTTCREFFHIFLAASGEGGPTQAVSLTAFFPLFFLITSLRSVKTAKRNLKIVGIVKFVNKCYNRQTNKKMLEN